MSTPTRGRRSTPSASPDPRREQLRALRDSIADRADQRRTAQTARLEQAQGAAAAGAAVREIVDATGLSRAWLHRAGIRAGATKLPAEAAAALETAAEIRDRLAELDAVDEQQKAERRRLALELLDAGSEISEKELAADAGVTAEWVRRRFSDV